MKKRYFELFLVLIVITGLAVFLSPESSDPRNDLIICDIVPSPAEPVQTSPDYDLWQARYQEGQDALGQGDNEKAEVSLKQALDLARQVGGDPLYLSHDALGLCYYRQAKYIHGVGQQREAVRRAAEAEKIELVALYESRLALSLVAIDQPGQAHEALQRARKAYRLAYPKGSPAYSEAMNSLAQQYRNMGDNYAAEELLQD